MIVLAEQADYSSSTSSTDWDTSLTWSEETQSTFDFAHYWESIEEEWWKKHDMRSDYSYGSTSVEWSSEATAVDSTDDRSDSSMTSRQTVEHNGWFTGEIESGTLEDDFIEYRNASEDETTEGHNIHFSDAGSTGENCVNRFLL